VIISYIVIHSSRLVKPEIPLKLHKNSVPNGEILNPKHQAPNSSATADPPKDD